MFEDINMAKTKNCCDGKIKERLGKVGGQAVIEGVMMKAGDRTVTTCRKEDGTIFVNDDSFISIRKKIKFLNIPILRGIVNFIEMLILSFKTLGVSAEALDIDSEKDKEKKAKGKSTTTDIIMVVGMVLGILLAVGLFIVLPGLCSDLVEFLCKKFGGFTLNETVKAIIEGVMKVIIFISYLLIVSIMPDIKRTFMYHGAEHKSIACFEAGAELTPENAEKYTRLHPRCGTSFMFVMIFIGILVGVILNNLMPNANRLVLSLIRLAILPVIVGVGYEFIMFAGKHDNFLTRALSAPGLWMQKITTREPTRDMLEIAIISIKCALRDDFPEFKVFYELSGWINDDPNGTDTAEESKNAESEDNNAEDDSDSASENGEK
ncbi:MAG: DUF1385 domain-containing protein [Ruminococcaceae bacterium]|nr:DUF1385 domain-containing protein [Oscillospiraceae bacterium]